VLTEIGFTIASELVLYKYSNEKPPVSTCVGQNRTSFLSAFTGNTNGTLIWLIPNGHVLGKMGCVWYSSSRWLCTGITHTLDGAGGNVAHHSVFLVFICGTFCDINKRMTVVVS